MAQAGTKAPIMIMRLAMVVLSVIMAMVMAMVMVMDLDLARLAVLVVRVLVVVLLVTVLTSGCFHSTDPPGQGTDVRGLPVCASAPDPAGDDGASDRG